MSELRRSARVAARPSSESSEPPKKKTKAAPKKEVKPKVKEQETTEANSELKDDEKPKDVKDEEPEAKKSKEIEVGDAIPDITLLDEEEKEISLPEAAKKTKFLVIFAYPKASTPGCTRQVCGFQANYEFLKSSDTTVFGLSADQPKSQKNFVTKQKLEYSLLSDPSRKLIGALGAKKSPSGIKRSHWIFVDGVLKVKKIQISPEVSVNSAKADIEEFIKNESK